MSNILPLPARMNEKDYDRARAELGQRKDAGAKWDQQLALLFTRSGWTQEQLAAREKKSRQWVEKVIRFGKFLNFATTVANSEIPLSGLAEGRFRDFWSRTAGTNEHQRFTGVLKLMQQEVGFRRPPLLQGISKAIVAEFADGKWHKFETIVTAVEKSEDDVRAAFGDLGRTASQARLGVTAVEKKPVGKSFAYRIFPATRSVDASELREKLGPIIEGLQEEGRKNMATMSPGTVARLAHDLKILVERWTK